MSCNVRKYHKYTLEQFALSPSLTPLLAGSPTKPSLFTYNCVYAVRCCLPEIIVIHFARKAFIYLYYMLSDFVLIFYFQVTTTTTTIITAKKKLFYHVSKSNWVEFSIGHASHMQVLTVSMYVIRSSVATLTPISISLSPSSSVSSIKIQLFSWRHYSYINMIYDIRIVRHEPTDIFTDLPCIFFSLLHNCVCVCCGCYQSIE